MKILLALLFLAASNSLAQTPDWEDNLAPPAESSSSVTQVPAKGERLPISVGLGSGLSTGTGNLGKLYSSSSPLLDIRAEYRLHPHLGLRAGFDYAQYNFTAMPVGAVRVGLTSIRGEMVAHLFATPRRDMDPYLTLGLGHSFRSQSFSSLGYSERDRAFNLGAGLGSNFFVIPGRAALWVEAKLTQAYFADRNESTYLPSGIEDTTGGIVSGGLGVQYYF